MIKLRLSWHNIFLISLLLQFTHAHGIIIKSVKDISISFKQRGWRWFGSQTSTSPAALRNVTADFSGITALCGTSKSGKSTLGKILAGQYNRDEWQGDIIYAVNGNSESRRYPTVYIDLLYYLSYDSTKPVSHYLTGLTSLNNISLNNFNHNDTKTSDLLLEIMQNIFTVPLDSMINNLLESQKKYFEILLAFTLIKRNTDNDSDKNNNSGNNNNKNNKYLNGGLLILDEYLDKDMTSVRDTFFTSLRQLCNHPAIAFQVIIITHSKKVVSYCDTVVVLQNGVKYTEGQPDRVMKYLPPTFVILP